MTMLSPTIQTFCQKVCRGPWGIFPGGSMHPRLTEGNQPLGDRSLNHHAVQGITSGGYAGGFMDKYVKGHTTEVVGCCTDLIARP